LRLTGEATVKAARTSPALMRELVDQNVSPTVRALYFLIKRTLRILADVLVVIKSHHTETTETDRIVVHN
jgi:hypothetical protein